MLSLSTSVLELQGKYNPLWPEKGKTMFKLYVRYGIAPRIVEPGQKPRIEVFNPCDDSDDQKTSTAILFDDEGNFIAFGQHAL